MGGILIDFQFILKEKIAPYWSSKERIERVLSLVFNNPFYELKYGNFKGTKIVKLGSLKDEVKRAEELGSVATYYSEKKDENEKARVFFNSKNSSDTELRFYLNIPLNKIEGIDQIQNFIWKVIEKLRDISYVYKSIRAVYRGELNFPRIRPLRFYGFLSEDAIINFFDKGYNYTYIVKMPKENGEAIVKAIDDNNSLNKVVKGDIIGVTWVKSLEKEDVEKGLSFREDFIQDTIVLPPTDEFTEEGDKKLFHISRFEKLPEDEYFSYYSERTGLAFKLIVLAQEMQLSDEDKTQIQKHYKSKVLKDGREIKKIIPIVPGRKYVLELDKVPKEIGIYKSLYIDDELNLWDITPSGNWKN